MTTTSLPGPAARARAAREEAQTIRGMADEVISHGLRFQDPLYDASWRIRQHYLDIAVILDELAGTFDAYALARHIEAVA